MENQKKTVLIVEDEVVLSNILKDKLEGENFLVSTAKNGEEGLSTALNTKPDLILLDIIMPKMDGIEMLKKMREDAWGKNVRVLLLTNDSNPDHMRESLKDNAVDYLIKSDWNLDEVVKKIRTRLEMN